MKFLLDLATSDPSNKALMNAHFIPDGVDCTGVVGIANSTGECGKKIYPKSSFHKIVFYVFIFDSGNYLRMRKTKLLVSPGFNFRLKITYLNYKSPILLIDYSWLAKTVALN